MKEKTQSMFQTEETGLLVLDFPGLSLASVCFDLRGRFRACYFSFRQIRSLGGRKGLDPAIMNRQARKTLWQPGTPEVLTPPSSFVILFDDRYARSQFTRRQPSVHRALDLPALLAKKSHFLLGPRQTALALRTLASLARQLISDSEFSPAKHVLSLPKGR